MPSGVAAVFRPFPSEGDGASVGEGNPRPRRRNAAAGTFDGSGRSPVRQRRISAMTSPYSVSPTGVKPIRAKKASGPASPSS